MKVGIRRNFGIYEEFSELLLTFFLLYGIIQYKSNILYLIKSCDEEWSDYIAHSREPMVGVNRYAFACPLPSEPRA